MSGDTRIATILEGHIGTVLGQTGLHRLKYILCIEGPGAHAITGTTGLITDFATSIYVAALPLANAFLRAPLAGEERPSTLSLDTGVITLWTALIDTGIDLFEEVIFNGR
jgi:hypothetical protein